MILDLMPACTFSPAHSLWRGCRSGGDLEEYPYKHCAYYCSEVHCFNESALSPGAASRTRIPTSKYSMQYTRKETHGAHKVPQTSVPNMTHAQRPVPATRSGRDAREPRRAFDAIVPLYSVHSYLQGLPHGTVTLYQPHPGRIIIRN